MINAIVSNVVPSTIFQGYNQILMTAKELCVTGVSESGNPTEPVICKIDICSDYLSVASTIGIDLSASVGFAGLGSAEGKYSFFKSLAVTDNILTVLVRSKVISGNLQRTSAAMNKDALSKNPSQQEIKAFIDKYGESYVSSITKGGEYIAAYVFHTETKEEASSIASSLAASGSVKSFSGDASFSQKITEVSKSVKCRISFSQTMYGVTKEPLPSEDKIFEFALNFPTLAVNAQTVLDWSLSGYETLLTKVENKKALNAIDPVVTNRNYFCGVASLPGKFKDLATLKGKRTQCTELQTTYNFYGGYTDGQVQDRAILIDGDIKKVEKQIKDFAKDPTIPLEDIELNSLDFGSPKLVVKSFQQSAGNLDGGLKFTHFDDPKSFISKRGKVCYIELNGDTRVIGMTTHYNIDGVEKAFGNGKEFKMDDKGLKANKDSKKLGGEDYHPILSYDASESGDLSYLRINTDLGSIHSGRLGESKSNSFKPDENQFFLYFEGHTWDGNIVEITFNFGSFKPALWVKNDD